MHVKHHRVIFWKISEVIPIAGIDESIMNCDNNDVVMLSNFMISQSVIILQSIELVLVIVAPKRGLIEKLDDTNCVLPFWQTRPTSDLTNDINCSIYVLVCKEFNCTRTSAVIPTVLINFKRSDYARLQRHLLTCEPGAP